MDTFPDVAYIIIPTVFQLLCISLANSYIIDILILYIGILIVLHYII